MPFEPLKPALRASAADRVAAVERLREAALEGRLDADELESRLAAAYSARTCLVYIDVTGTAFAPFDDSKKPPNTNKYYYIWN